MIGREERREEKEKRGSEGGREGGKFDPWYSDVKNNLTISVTCLSNFKIHSLFSFSHKMEQIQT